MTQSSAHLARNILMLAGFLVPAWAIDSENVMALRFAVFALWPATWAIVFFWWQLEQNERSLEFASRALEHLRNGDE